MYSLAHPLLFFIYLFFFFFFFKEKADWDGVPPLYSEAGGLKVASPGVLFISPYCVSGRWSPAFLHHQFTTCSHLECFAQFSCVFHFVLLKAL